MDGTKGNKKLKKKIKSGFIYKFAERVGANGVKFILSIVLARILSTHDYGLISLVLVFITICDVFVTYGFGNSLIANKKSDQLDFSTCFYFGFFLSIILYAVLYCVAPFIAGYYGNYDKELLTSVIRVMGIRLPIAAINSVQHAYVSKNMWFKKFFYATMIGTVISGIIALFMAYNGFGVWALVEQYLGNVILDTICLWIIVGWRPTKEFSFARLKVIYSYGWKILVVGLIDTVYSRLRNLIIGKKYSSDDLAFYNRGYTFPSFGMRLIEPTVNSVLFPALSSCQDNLDEMRNITRKVLQVSTYVISPFMIGLAIVAKPLVIILLTEKWIPCVIYLQIGCIANLFRCQQFINNCVIKASGRSGLLLKLDILKKFIGIGILIVSVRFGVIAIAWSLVAVYFISMVINVAPNRQLLKYGYLIQFKDVGMNMLPAIVMGICIYPFCMLEMSPVVLLLCQIVVGIAIYLGLSVLMKNESFIYVLSIVKGMYKHKND